MTKRLEKGSIDVNDLAWLIWMHVELEVQQRLRAVAESAALDALRGKRMITYIDDL